MIGKNQTSAASLGLHLHATLAVSDTGLPLGVLRLGFDAAVKRTPEAAKRKKSERWLDAFPDTAAAVREVGDKTRVLSICDREADFYELSDARRKIPRVGLLARAKHDRVLGKARSKLFETLSGGAAEGRIAVEITGLMARTKFSRKTGRPMRRKCLAQCELRFRRVVLPATITGGKPVTVSGMHIIESTRLRTRPRCSRTC